MGEDEVLVNTYVLFYTLTAESYQNLMRGLQGCNVGKNKKDGEMLNSG